MRRLFPIAKIWIGRIFPGRDCLAILLLISMAVACGKEDQSMPDTTNPPGPLPDATNTSGARIVTMVDLALDEWKYYPYSGPENGEDSVFLAKASLTGVDFNRLGRINAVYLSEPSGSRFAVKLASLVTIPMPYSYSIDEVGEYGSSFLRFAFTQLSPGTRPLADSAHVELAW